MTEEITIIKLYNTNITFVISGVPTYPEMVRYAIQNDIPISYHPIFDTTRSTRPIYKPKGEE
jgi:hypothetical protein